MKFKYIEYQSFTFFFETNVTPTKIEKSQPKYKIY